MTNLQAVIEAIKEQSIENQQAQAQSAMDFQYRMLSNEMMRDYKDKKNVNKQEVSTGQGNVRTYHPYKDVRAKPISGSAEYQNFVMGHNFSKVVEHDDKGLGSLAKGASIQEHNKQSHTDFQKQLLDYQDKQKEEAQKAELKMNNPEGGAVTGMSNRMRVPAEMSVIPKNMRGGGMPPKIEEQLRTNPTPKNIETQDNQAQITILNPYNDNPEAPSFASTF
tara:strand:- start:102 stop:764 length:663 start_codon:yes stop_codon:yes gene_type:complete